MRQLTINPNNRQYYSEDFIKGFNCGAHRQFEADKSDADRPQGEWVEKEIFGEYNDDVHHYVSEWQGARCSVCGKYHTTPYAYYFDEYNYCPSCGAHMKGADDYERAIEQTEHDMLYEPTYNSEDGSM